MAKGPAPQSQGPIHGVKCPHCGAPNDFRELLTQGDTTIFPNTEVFCDHCGWMMIVKQVLKVTMIKVVPAMRRDPQHGQAAQGAHTISPQQARKLLK